MNKSKYRLYYVKVTILFVDVYLTVYEPNIFLYITRLFVIL